MATVWSSPPAQIDVDRVRVAQAACTTGSEVAVQGADHLTDGIDLKGLAAVTPHIELPAGNVAAGASLQAYLLNPATSQWNRAPQLDLPLTGGGPAEGLPGIQITGPSSRLQLLPKGVGAACSVYLIGSPAPTLMQR